MEKLVLNEEIFEQAIDALAKKDPVLHSVVQKLGPPPFWKRPPGFATLIQIILEQQVSLASGKAVFERLKTHLGEVSVESIYHAGEEGLRQLGVTRQKARYCHHLAVKVREGTFDFGRLHQLPNNDALAYLCGLKGVGPWTAEVYLLMAMQRADIFPSGDLALVKAYQRLYNRQDKIHEKAMHWSPYRAVAARILWHYYLSTR